MGASTNQLTASSQASLKICGLCQKACYTVRDPVGRHIPLPLDAYLHTRDIQACFWQSQLVVGAADAAITSVGSAPSPVLTRGVVCGSAAAGPATATAIGQRRTTASADRTTASETSLAPHGKVAETQKIGPASSLASGITAQASGDKVRVAKLSRVHHELHTSPTICFAIVVVAAFGAAPHAGARSRGRLAKDSPGRLQQRLLQAMNPKSALAAVDCRKTIHCPGVRRMRPIRCSAITPECTTLHQEPAGSCVNARALPRQEVVRTHCRAGIGRQTGGFLRLRPRRRSRLAPTDGALARRRNAEHFLGVAYVRYEGRAISRRPVQLGQRAADRKRLHRRRRQVHGLAWRRRNLAVSSPTGRRTASRRRRPTSRTWRISIRRIPRFAAFRVLRSGRSACQRCLGNK